jgi:hypothetical protein
MQKFYCILLGCILCLMLIASGCTSPSPAATATPAATTAAPVASPPQGTTTTTPEIPSWSGTWNTTWREIDGNQTFSVVTFTQAGPDVTGNYRFTYPEEGTFTGYFNATVAGNTLTGTYYDSDDDVGYLIFALSADGNSFTGRWVHAENQSELATTPNFWNGVRIAP